MSPDPLLMSADIARVASERPELEEDLVQALYQHLVLVQGRQPTLEERREYVDRVSSLDQGRLRQRLGLEPRKRGGRRTATRLPTATKPTARVADADRPAGAGATRRPGRPGWTRELFAARYQAALRRAAPPHTYQAIADQFEMLDGSVGTDPDHLRKLMKRFGQAPG
jgi:hypothetical protein